MGNIVKTNDGAFDKNAKVNVEGMLIPEFRLLYARDKKVDKKILIKLSGGMGDNICAEPAIRYAINHFKGNTFSITGEHLELFQHLDAKFYDFDKNPLPDDEGYLTFDTFDQDGSFNYNWLVPPFIHCVDYASLKMFRCQLPMADRCAQLHPKEKAESYDVVIHPGKTWPSRTAPKEFWDQIIFMLRKKGVGVTLIGQDIPHDQQPRGTVAVDASDCLDLRNKLDVMQTVGVLQAAKVVLTNDSSPLHMAASGQAWIGFLSTARHPEIITHYRNGGEFGWRMKNFASGGVWESFDMCPNASNLRMDLCRRSDMAKWLPEPKTMASWALEKLCGT